MGIEKVGVVGCGQMGGGIAQVFAQAGYPVVVMESTQALLDKGIARIDSQLARGVEKGRLSAEDRQATMGRIQGTLDFTDFAACDLVIEAIVEQMDEKKRVFAALDQAVQPQAILASNTSSLPIIEIATATARRERVAGMHFFNPVPVMPIVEVVRTIVTSDETIEAAAQEAAAAADPRADHRGSVEYKRNLVRVFTTRGVRRAYERARKGG